MTKNFRQHVHNKFVCRKPAASLLSNVRYQKCLTIIFVADILPDFLIAVDEKVGLLIVSFPIFCPLMLHNLPMVDVFVTC